MLARQAGGFAQQGEVALDSFSAKARYGAKQLYLYLDGDSEAPEATSDAESADKIAMNDPAITAQQLDQKALANMIKSAD